MAHTVSLLSVKRRSNPVVHDNEGTAVLGVREHSSLDGSVKVGRTIGGDRSGRSHGAHDDDGFATVDGEVHCEMWPGDRSTNQQEVFRIGLQAPTH